MRKILWHAVLHRLPEGSLLPTWAVAIRWVLFPIDSAYWALGRRRGYDVHRDVWWVEGLQFTGQAMHAIARGAGRLYLVTRDGDTVSLRDESDAISELIASAEGFRAVSSGDEAGHAGWEAAARLDAALARMPGIRDA